MKIETQQIDDEVIQFTVAEDGKPVSFEHLFTILKTGEFIQKMNTVIEETKFKAFFLEFPPLTKAQIAFPAEFVLINAPILEDLQSDSSAFDNQLQDLPAGQLIHSFPNLRGDSMMIVPVPQESVAADYAHLAKFLRNAPLKNQVDLWATVYKCLFGRMATSEDPVWLSTCGHAVPWLHVRLDPRPKYYSYPKYRDSLSTL